MHSVYLLPRAVSQELIGEFSFFESTADVDQVAVDALRVVAEPGLDRGYIAPPVIFERIAFH